MNLIETDSLFLSEKTITKILQLLQKGKFKKANDELKQPLQFDPKAKTLDSRLIHYFASVHKVLAETIKASSSKTLKDANALGKNIGETNGLLNGLKKDLNKAWEPILKKKAVHQSMASLLTKSFFNEAQWRLKKSWKNWLPDLSSYVLSTSEAKPDYTIIPVDHLFSFFDKDVSEATLMNNALNTISNALINLAQDDLSQDCDTLLSQPKYAALANPLQFPDNLFSDMSDFTQAELCMFFLAKCHKPNVFHLLRYLNKLIEKNYFPTH